MTSTSTASTSTTSAASLHQFLAAHRVEKSGKPEKFFIFNEV